MEGGVAGRGGDTDEVDFFVPGGEDDGEGVIEAGIAVKPDLYFRLHFNILVRMGERIDSETLQKNTKECLFSAGRK